MNAKTQQIPYSTLIWGDQGMDGWLPQFYTAVLNHTGKANPRTSNNECDRYLPIFTDTNTIPSLSSYISSTGAYSS